MNIDDIMTDRLVTFVHEHRSEDVRDLALHARRDGGIDMTFALDQIAGWQTARTKLPEWAASEGIVYPSHLSMEQCSSEPTARYKAGLAASLTRSADAERTGGVDDAEAGDDAESAGEAESKAQRTDRGSKAGGKAGNAATASTTLVDLTGGFGVDFSYMARSFDHAVYVERQEHLCDLARHNLRALGLANRTDVVNDDAATYLARMAPASLIFLDPARRDAHGSRTYAIADCTPDVLALEDALLDKARHVMIKLSPMLDWHKTVADLKDAVSQVHIVSVGNECKELLVVLSRGHGGPATIHCMNDGLDFSFRADDPSPDPLPRTCSMADLTAMLDAGTLWLAEPNASVMKSGRFDLVASRFDMRPLNRDSHLFVADAAPVDFPGRVFVLDAVTGMGKRDLRTAIGDLTHANITTRNFPIGVPQLRRKLGLKDGGEVTLFATTAADGARMLLRARRA